MSDRLTESLADIQSKLTRFTWEVMDEEQRDEVMNKVVLPRWGKTTRDGHMLKGTLWAEILGTTVRTIEARHHRLEQRLRRSEGSSEATRLAMSESQKQNIRGVKAVARDPEAAKKLVEDPEVRAALKEAMGDGPDLEAQQAAANKARREEQEKAEMARQQLLKEQAAEREILRQEKLEALGRLEKQLKEEAKKQEFDVSSLTAEQKAQVMTLLANDPKEASRWFKAQNEERARKLTEETKKAKEAAIKHRQQMDDREAREAARKASQDYDESALCYFLEEVLPLCQELGKILDRKSVTFDHILRSNYTANELVRFTEEAEDIVVQVREALFSANAEAELADLAEPSS